MIDTPDKYLTYEKGRLRGMLDLRRLLRIDVKTMISNTITAQYLLKFVVEPAIQEQETVVKEMKEMVE